MGKPAIVQAFMPVWPRAVLAWAAVRRESSGEYQGSKMLNQ
jgi:hypothetical protein